MNLRERFESKVSPEPTSGCHLWMAAVNGAGYGMFRHRGRILKAHRVAWELAHGPLPEKAHVLHRCDVPGCVSVHHLFLGSNLDNVKDRTAKGRGSNQNVAKTHCPKGHPFAGENLRLKPDGRRRCFACHRATMARWRSRKR